MRIEFDNFLSLFDILACLFEENKEKNAKVPEKRYLDRLYNRNEFYIESKHPLAETIINQTGKTKAERIRFLNKQYQLALDYSIQTWKPSEEYIGNF